MTFEEFSRNYPAGSWPKLIFLWQELELRPTPSGYAIPRGWRWGVNRRDISGALRGQKHYLFVDSEHQQLVSLAQGLYRADMADMSPGDTLNKVIEGEKRLLAYIGPLLCEAS